MINMNISEEGISLIKNYEGCKLEAYQDSVGVWTIGYGHTKDVKDGDKINQDEAEHLLQEEMPEYEGYINDMVKVLTENGVTLSKVLKNKKKIVSILENYSNKVNYQGGTKKFIKEVIQKLPKE